MRHSSRTRSVSLLAAALSALFLSACSSAVERPFPTLSDFKTIGTDILSKSETEKAIKDLSEEQKQQQADAEKRLKGS